MHYFTCEYNTQTGQLNSTHLCTTVKPKNFIFLSQKVHIYKRDMFSQYGSRAYVQNI